MIAGGGDSEVDREILLSATDLTTSMIQVLRRRTIYRARDRTDPIASTNSSGEAHLSIARFSEQALALMAVSASSLSGVGEDGLAIVDISKLTTVKILDKRSSSSGVKYKCKLEPLWLATNLAERAQIGHVHIRSYKNSLIRANRLENVKEKKEEAFTKCNRVK